MRRMEGEGRKDGWMIRYEDRECPSFPCVCTIFGFFLCKHEVPTTPTLVFTIFASYSVEIAQIRRSPGSRKGTASPYIYLMPVQQILSGGISWGRYKIQICFADSHISASILKS